MCYYAINKINVFSRSLRGNVDRNFSVERGKHNVIRVVPYVGTWIEIYDSMLGDYSNVGRSLRGNVDRNYDIIL